MSFLTSIIALFVIIFLSLLINRIATVALTHTGLSRDMARFQARSAFTTAGFTTSESESVINHPVRRRIISMLMFAGNLGFVSIMATTLVSITAAQQGEGLLPTWAKLLILAGGLVLLGALSTSKWVDDLLFKIIGWALRRFADFETHDFLNLLQIGQGYTVTELIVEPGDWLAGQRLDELRLTEAGVNILGIHRGDGGFVGTPTGDTYIRKNDKLILYGARTRIMELDRTKGDDEAGERHKQAVEASRRKWRERADERADGYDVSEMVIRKKSWMVGRRLDELRLPDVGINILGIKRENGAYIGTPAGNSIVRPEDKLVVYGSLKDLEWMDASREEADGEADYAQRAVLCRDERHKRALAAEGPAQKGTAP